MVVFMLSFIYSISSMAVGFYGLVDVQLVSSVDILVLITRPLSCRGVLTFRLVAHLGTYDFHFAENTDGITELDDKNGAAVNRGISWNLPKCGCNL